ncbi:MAG TPA: hypothetical protein VN922_19385 [Bacteroidia bacterium]|nr:hypothetical protein [Bacteroidia bacterium]
MFNGKSISVISYYQGTKRFNFTPKCGDEKKEKKHTPIKQKPKKATGERVMHLEIWAERPHVCFVTETPLGKEPLPIYFMHVLGKGAYPNFRLEKKNIVLGLPEIHEQYDAGTTINDPRFKPLLELKQKLKEEYYKK